MEAHGIRIPGIILDEIRNKEDETSGRKFALGNKRKVSRKDVRKEKRLAKKLKRSHKSPVAREQVKEVPVSVKGAFRNKKNKQAKKTVSIDESLNTVKSILPAYKKEDFFVENRDFDEEEDFDEDWDDEEEQEDLFSDLEGPDQPQTPQEVFEALRNAKLGKTGPSMTKKVAKKEVRPEKRVKTAKETMEALMNGRLGNIEEENEDEEDSDFSGDSEEISDLEGPDQPQSVEEVFAALKKAKAAKTEPQAREEIFEEEDSEISGDDSEEISDLEGPNQPKTPAEVFAALKAAKLGGTMNKTKPAPNKTKEQKKKVEEPGFLNEHDQDEENIKYYAKKLGLKNMKLDKVDDDDIVGGLFEGLDFMDDYGDSSKSEDPYEDEEELEDEELETERVRENPYVAPVSATAKSYIPPAFRNSNGDDESKLRIQRQIKGQLNKLSEVTLIVISGEIDRLYIDHPRHLVTETITKTILENVLLLTKLLDNFVILYAGLVAALYRFQGVEFVVYFVQEIVENFEKYYLENLEDKGKQSSNILSLLTFCYSLRVVSCTLIYDIIKLLISSFNEYNSELLLRLIRNAGTQLRSDDPLALREIVKDVYENSKGKNLSPRTKFLIECIENLKNNKTRQTEEMSGQLIIKMRKALGTINNNRIQDPLAVSLEDIHNADSRGKWWLTGGAWKGKENNSRKVEEKSEVFENVNEGAINDIIDAEPNWNELAKQHRMNNDVRRAIFTSIMSSEDFVDAFKKLDKLQLKRAQQKEIPRILLHCQQIEPGFNKFYALLAAKLCAEHAYRKTFQFCLWEYLRSINDEEGEEDIFASNNESEDEKLQKLVNSGKFFGYLMGVGSLHLNLLRVINFLTINSDTALFLEIFFVEFFQKVVRLSDGVLQERFEKVGDPILLKGIQIFFKKHVKRSNFIKAKYQAEIDSAIKKICNVGSS